MIKAHSVVSYLSIRYYYNYYYLVVVVVVVVGLHYNYDYYYNYNQIVVVVVLVVGKKLAHFSRSCSHSATTTTKMGRRLS